MTRILAALNDRQVGCLLAFCDYVGEAAWPGDDFWRRPALDARSNVEKLMDSTR